MTAQLLEGGPVAEAVLDDVRARVAALKAIGVTPGLGTILVGDDGASTGYVRKKHETCESVGLASSHIQVQAGDPPGSPGRGRCRLQRGPVGTRVHHPAPGR